MHEDRILSLERQVRALRRLTADGADRVVLGFDRAGREAVSLSVDGEGRAGLVAEDADQRMRPGSATVPAR